MKIAAAKAIADLAKEDVPDEVASAYPVKDPNMAQIILFLRHLIQD